MQATRTIRAVIKAVVDIFEEGGFEFRVVHTSTIARVACGALVDNSYSSGMHGLLYGTAWRHPVLCHSHKFAALEDAHVFDGQFEPLATATLVGESLVPIGFDAIGVVGADDVDQFQFFG
jgi:hypothetical protein